MIKLSFIGFILVIGVAATPINGFYTVEGDTYYYKDNILQKGIQKIESDYYFLGEYSGKMQYGFITSSLTGDVYYANQEGKLQTGFLDKDEDRYYFDDTGKMQKGVRKIGEDYYFLGEYSGKMQYGFITSSFTGDVYYANKNGKLHSGFLDYNYNRYYFNPTNCIMMKGFFEVNHAIYYSDEEGKIVIGERIINGKKYNFSLNGILYQGFVTDSLGDTYYYVDGYIQKGITRIGNDDYFLGEYSGKVQTGFVTSSLTGAVYYADSTGKILKGIQSIDGKDYFLGEYTGKVQTGIVQSSSTGKYYFMNNLGIIYKNIFTIDDQEYYATETGALYEGFIKVDTETYYFVHGKKQLGITKINGEDYFLGEYTGRVIVGFVTSSFTGNTYYTNDVGKILKGIQIINGNRYFLGELSGKLQTGWIHALNGKIYYTNNEGIIQTGKQEIEGRVYVFDEAGVIKTGFQTIDGVTYYYNHDGSMAIGVQTIHGVRYRFALNGALRESNFKILADVSHHQGNIDWNTLWSSKAIDGAILRIGYNGMEDNMFPTYLSEVKRLNIPYGVYLFSYAHNPAEAIFEANATITMLRKYNVQPKYPVYYDLEYYEIKSTNETSNDISKEAYEGIAFNYLTTLRNYGYQAKIYTGLNYAMTRFTENTRKEVDWIAHYTNQDCGYQGPHSGWQYTSKGNLPGINGNVDLNIFYY